MKSISASELFKLNMRSMMIAGAIGPALAFLTMFGMQKNLDKKGLNEDEGARNAACALCLTASALSVPVGYSMLSARNKGKLQISAFEQTANAQNMRNDRVLKTANIVGFCQAGAACGMMAANAPDIAELCTYVAAGTLVTLVSGQWANNAAHENLQYVREQYRP